MVSTKLTQAPVTVSLSTTSARNGTILPPGIYQVTCDVDCFILQGGSGVTALTSSNPLWSKAYAAIRIDAGDGYIAGILASGTGTLYCLKALD